MDDSFKNPKPNPNFELNYFEYIMRYIEHIILYSIYDKNNDQFEVSFL